MTKLALMRRARWLLCLLALAVATSAVTALMLVLNRYHVVCTRFKIARDIGE